MERQCQSTMMRPSILHRICMSTILLARDSQKVHFLHPPPWYHKANKAGQMHWLLTKGESLSATTPKRVSIECCRTFRPTDPRVFTAKLVACNDDYAPRRYFENSNFPSPPRNSCHTKRVLTAQQQVYIMSAPSMPT